MSFRQISLLSDVSDITDGRGEWLKWRELEERWGAGNDPTAKREYTRLTVELERRGLTVAKWTGWKRAARDNGDTPRHTGGWEYKVQWRGDYMYEDSWEPQEVMRRTEDMKEMMEKARATNQIYTT